MHPKLIDSPPDGCKEVKASEILIVRSHAFLFFSTLDRIVMKTYCSSFDYLFIFPCWTNDIIMLVFQMHHP